MRRVGLWYGGISLVVNVFMMNVVKDFLDVILWNRNMRIMILIIVCNIIYMYKMERLIVFYDY